MPTLDNNVLPKSGNPSAAMIEKRFRLRTLAWNSFWFFVIPVALTLLFAWKWMPGGAALSDNLPVGIARFAANPIILCVLLFLVFSGLFRYWRHYLPGHAFKGIERTEPLARFAPSGHATQRSRGSRRWLKAGCVISTPLILAGIFRLYVFQSYTIQGNSMLPTFSSGDEVGARPNGTSLGIPWNISTAPKRGEIIILDNPTSDGEAEIVKRVIGLPGDQIKVKGGIPEINGWKVPNCDAGLYANITPNFEPVQGHVVVEFLGDKEYLTLYESTKVPDPSEVTYTVGAGHVFVLGDNRYSSSDSRAWGSVPVSRIGGRVNRFLVGTSRSGEAEFAHFFAHTDSEVKLAGLDTQMLKQRIKNCRDHKPKSPWPPSGVSAALVAQVSLRN